MPRSPFAPLLLLAAGLLLLNGCDGGRAGGSGETSPSGESDIRAGYRLMDEGRFADAIPRFEQALEDSSSGTTPSDILTSIGNCYDELDDFEKALDYHERAIEADPRNHKAHANKGVVHRHLGEYDEATASYREAVRLEPNYPEVHASLGALAFFRGNYDEAVASLEKAVALDDSLAVAHSNLALAYASTGRYDDADEEVKKAVERGYSKGQAVRERIAELRGLAKEK